MARPIRFLLDGAVRELPPDTDPTLTVLNWLRYEARRTGTKEGCAEGDCGACTVVLAERDGDGLAWRAANACILFAPMLDGKALFTVESLGREDALHGVQQALVEHHASQCGFCTPGFAMTLFAIHKGGDGEDSPADALAGNLCRCTGYGPLLAAADAAMDLVPDDDTALRDALDALAAETPLEVAGKGRRLIAPRSSDGVAAALLANPEAVVLAGGTDVGLWVTKQHRNLPVVVALGAADDLKRIDDLGDAVRIGAAVTYAQARPVLASLHPDFDTLLRRIGGPQVRNLGTVCGNLANGSPIGDMPPALIAAGARLVLRRGYARRELPLEAFFLDYGRQDRAPGEFVEAVIVPRIPTDRVFALAKLSKRFDQDISAVCLGLSVGLEDGCVTDARIAFGGMAATPKRAATCEAALVGRPWSADGVAPALVALAADFNPISDMRASADYRLQAARNLILRTVLGDPALAALEPVDG